MASQAGTAPDLDATLAHERAVLVRMCRRLTGNSEVAEDLAHEALFEACRSAGQLRDPSRRRQWLWAITRHICLRWLRRRRLELARRSDPDLRPAMARPEVEDPATEGFAVELELERGELARLLDRAMALLPPATRVVLIQRYVQDTPQADIALAQGLSHGAVAMRLQRGKLALRRLLTTEFREEAAAYGLVDRTHDGWQETRIWCPVCGRRRLLGRFPEPKRELWLDCVGCLGLPRSTVVRGGSAELFEGISGYRRAFGRQLAEAHSFFESGIAGRTAPCPRCGSAAPLRTSPAGSLPFRYVQTTCPQCGEVFERAAVSFLALARPEGRRFWSEHPRIRMLPDAEVDAYGPAVVTRFESLTNSARLAVVFSRDTLDVVRVHEE